MYLIVNKCFLLGINRRKPAGVRPFGSWVTLAQIIMAALMQVASLTGDFCGRSTWLKNKHKFPQVEWNRAAKKSQQGPEQARVNGWMRSAVSPTRVPFPTLTVREASAPSCFHPLIRGQSPAPCTQVIWIHCHQSSKHISHDVATLWSVFFQLLASLQVIRRVDVLVFSGVFSLSISRCVQHSLAPEARLSDASFYFHGSFLCMRKLYCKNRFC